jgi:hypothetical protein
MKLVKTDLRGLSSLQVLMQTRFILSKMRDNPNFPNPTPSLEAIDEACTELQLSLSEAYDGGTRLAYHTKKVKTEKVSSMLKTLAAYVGIVSQGERTMVLSSGFEQRKPSTRIKQLQAPKGVMAKTGKQHYTIDLRWPPVHGARFYKIYGAKGRGPQDGYELMTETSNSRITVDGLDPLAYYTFKVQAVGSFAESGLSNTAIGLSVGVA